jgi:hypothetical protein
VFLDEFRVARMIWRPLSTSWRSKPFVKVIASLLCVARAASSRAVSAKFPTSAPKMPPRLLITITENCGSVTVRPSNTRTAMVKASTETATSAPRRHQPAMVQRRWSGSGDRASQTPTPTSTSESPTFAIPAKRGPRKLEMVFASIQKFQREIAVSKSPSVITALSPGTIVASLCERARPLLTGDMCTGSK